MRLNYTLFCCFLSFFAKAQQPAPHPFACLHIHTSFKHYGREIAHPDSILHGWQINPTAIRKRYGTVNWDTFLPNVARRESAASSKMWDYDQAGFREISGSPGSLLCTSIYPYEKQFATSRLKQWISHSQVSGQSLKRLATYGSDSSYPFKEFYAEYLFLASQRPHLGKGPKIVLARDRRDLKLLKDGTTVQVLTIEGGHTLYGPICGDPDLVRLATATKAEREEIDRNIHILRTLPHKVFFITPAHFTDNKIAGFCKTIDREGLPRVVLAGLSRLVNIRESFFTKFGDGIHGRLDTGDEFDVINQNEDKECAGTELPYTYKSDSDDSMKREGYGWQVISQLLARDNPADNSHRILIDIKHMDIKARFQYYHLLKQQYANENIPIIASHVAVSGEPRPVAVATGLWPFFDIYDELDDPEAMYEREQHDDEFWHCFTKHLDDSDRALYFNPDDPRREQASFNPFEQYDTLTAGWFYPWSINLADEEIKIIYESKGIIGLNFDPRILGGSMPNYQDIDYKPDLEGEYEKLKTNPSFNAGRYPFESYWNCEPLLRNMYYVALRSYVKDSTAWDRIAFGTDFDGLIAPLKECPTAAEMPQFFDKLATFIPIFWELHHKNEETLWGKTNLMYGLSGQRIAEKVFFENARDFIMKNY